MFATDPYLINEEFYAKDVPPDQMDEAWSKGWRHFGSHFFRYNLGFYGSEIRRVIPLRIRLSSFSLSKRHRRILRRNSDLTIETHPLVINESSSALFDRHKTRFSESIPRSIFDFLPDSDANSPCKTFQFSVFEGEHLVAESYLDIGSRSSSGVYGIFDPDEKNRGLGIFTLLKEIEFAINADHEFYYLGYSYEGRSFYDYKKQFTGTETFDWIGNWRPFIEAKS